MSLRNTAPERIDGPISGGQHGWAFGSPLSDLEQRGYQEAEWFIEGEAVRYRSTPVEEWDVDGRWSAEIGDKERYKTRILIHHPADPRQFNGIVLVYWNNVSLGFDLIRGESDECLNGFAFVGASVQRAGVHGFADDPLGLLAWDPERYGSLHIVTDDISYDIFTQVASTVGPNRLTQGGPNDPLGGLDVRHVVAIGASQSAARLLTYHNAIHPLTEVFDGYILQIHLGRGHPLEVGGNVLNPNYRTPAEAVNAVLNGCHRVRDDIGVPVIVVNSELEAIACARVRQPDSDTFRNWEVAGTCHQSLQGARLDAIKALRDFRRAGPIDEQMNRVPLQPVDDAALAAMRLWLQTSDPPPSQPHVTIAEFGLPGVPAELARDNLGLAIGGIRLPQIAEPLMCHSAVPLAEGIFPLLAGSSRPLPRSTLTDRYGDEEGYITEFVLAAERAIETGVLLRRDLPSLEGEARSEWAEALDR
jgi:hypothetical protein